MFPALSAGPTGGHLSWTYHIQGLKKGNIENTPAVGPDGTIYVATGGTYGNTPSDIEAVNPNGTLKWTYVSNGTFETTPAVRTRRKATSARHLRSTIPGLSTVTADES